MHANDNTVRMDTRHTFDFMRFPEPWLRLRNGAPKVRKGKVGGYREVLFEEDIVYLDSVFERAPAAIASGM